MNNRKHIKKILIILLLSIYGLVWLEDIQFYSFAANNDDNMYIDECTEETSTNFNLSEEFRVLLQNPELPNGCEITSLTAVLNYWNIDVNKVDLSIDYLEKVAFKSIRNKYVGANPELAFAGDPSESTGWYVYESPIINAGLSYFEDNDIEMNIDNLTYYNFYFLLEVIDQGYPVVIWTTLDYTEPNYSSGWYLEDGSYYDAISNVHCVVLTGYDDENVTIMDPLKGTVEVDLEQFEISYNLMGKRAVLVN